MSASRGWTNDIFKAEDIQIAKSINEDIAFNRLEKVVLARWIVFRAFIEVAMQQTGGRLPDSIKRDWLLFQITPATPGHPFVALINTCLVGVSREVLVDLLAQYETTTVLGPAFDPEHDSFFYVLDEAQVAGEQYMSAFADGTATAPQPVLRLIIQVLDRPGIEMIVSGTGFPLDVFTTIVTPGAGKPNVWEVVHATGDSKNRETQESYIIRYLPPSFRKSQSGVALIARMFEWLRGRQVRSFLFLPGLMLIGFVQTPIYGQLSRVPFEGFLDD